MQRIRRFLRRAFSFERLVALAVLAGLAAMQIIDPGPVQALRLKTFDLYQQLKPREIPAPQAKPVTIIDIDENSLAEVGQWPWPRTVIATMTRNLMQMGAAQVAFDVVFAEPDRMNPSNIADTLVGLDDETRNKLRALPANDDQLAQVIRQSRVVLGQAGYWEKRDAPAAPPVKKSVAIKGPNPHNLLPSFISLTRNVPTIESVAAGHGIFSLVPEPDGIVRRVPTLFVHEGEIYPSLSVEMLRVAFARPTILIETDAAGVSGVGIAAARQFPPKGLKIATDRNGQVWPYFSKSDKAKYVSARDVLAGTADPALIKGKLTIVGTSAVGLLDIRSTPVDPVIPGVEVHAQLIEAALTGAYLDRPANFRGAELLLLIFGGLLMIWLVPRVGAKWTMLLFATVAAGAAGMSAYLFVEQRLLLDVAYSIIAILLLYTLLTYAGYAREEKQRQQVRSAFSHYLSPDMVARLAENPDQLKLGGERRDMTMLFCDVRGFTTISEQFDAEGLTRLINKLLTPLTNVILSNRGTVDKYMGDCIMAFWNAPMDDPDHARNACRSALKMLGEMEPLNARLESEAVAEGRKFNPLRVGIGLNSGEVVVGNMGSDQRFDYSVLGDSVNLASRLEGQSKNYGVNIVIGERTRAQAPDFASLELDLIKVKGKTEAVRIYVLLGDEKTAAGNAYQGLVGAHQEMLDAYRAQRWDEARGKAAICRTAMDGFDLGGLYDLYEERIAEYQANPPGLDWDGVFVATSK